MLEYFTLVSSLNYRDFGTSVIIHEAVVPACCVSINTAGPEGSHMEQLGTYSAHNIYHEHY